MSQAFGAGVGAPKYLSTPRDQLCYEANEQIVLTRYNAIRFSPMYIKTCVFCHGWIRDEVSFRIELKGFGHQLGLEAPNVAELAHEAVELRLILPEGCHGQGMLGWIK